MNTAKISPRLEDGKIYWYQGNTFAIKLKFDILENQVEKILSATDQIIVNFRPKFKPEIILTMSFVNIIDNTITIQIDREKTQIFEVGAYLIGATLNGDNITTLIPFNDVIVEGVV